MLVLLLFVSSQVFAIDQTININYAKHSMSVLISDELQKQIIGPTFTSLICIAKVEDVVFKFSISRFDPIYGVEVSIGTKDKTIALGKQSLPTLGAVSYSLSVPVNNGWRNLTVENQQTTEITDSVRPDMEPRERKQIKIIPDHGWKISEEMLCYFRNAVID